MWQRIALTLGWKTWDVGAKNEEHDLIETEAKAKRKEEGKAKAKETREAKKIRENKKAMSEYDKFVQEELRREKLEAEKNK